MTDFTYVLSPGNRAAQRRIESALERLDAVVPELRTTAQAAEDAILAARRRDTERRAGRDAVLAELRQSRQQVSS